MTQPTVRYNALSKELILAHCHYVALPSELIDTYGTCTEYLDCSHNRLMNLSYLYEFTNLEYLVLDNNRLHEAHFQQLQWSLPKVKLLMLNRNELMDLQRTITLLASIFPNLEYLSLHGNPICPDKLELQPFCEYVNYEYEHYRSQISSQFGQLKFLDHYDLQNPNHRLSNTPSNSNKDIREKTTPFEWLKNRNNSPKPFKQPITTKMQINNISKIFTFGKLGLWKKAGPKQSDESEVVFGIANKKF
ncbi:leucine-rich melanocyte differentiation-associated protein [Ceratitis capitata]|uniref:leucine-rich melanocyte differentiation-associated protein n=1 Tax=Ceratitis capitata TaxID=7213 RepID=UPI0006189206|nr:leucine-rich melanocyte differentiation-associated protein [Ceratitis capitata]